MKEMRENGFTSSARYCILDSFALNLQVPAPPEVFELYEYGGFCDDVIVTHDVMNLCHWTKSVPVVAISFIVVDRRRCDKADGDARSAGGLQLQLQLPGLPTTSPPSPSPSRSPAE
jgi:hypothetical protein